MPSESHRYLSGFGFPWISCGPPFDVNLNELKWSMRSGQDDCRFHLHSQLGHRWSLVFHSSLLPRPGSGVSFHYPLLMPLPLLSGPQPYFLMSLATIIWRMQSVSSPAVLLTPSWKKHIPLTSPPPRSSYFPLMDPFKWQVSSCCHDLSVNVVQGTWGHFGLRGCYPEVEMYHANLEFHGQHCVDSILKVRGHSGVPWGSGKCFLKSRCQILVLFLTFACKVGA